MNIYKKGMVLSLAASIALSPMVIKAEEYDESIAYMPISVTDEVKTPEYIKFKGNIEEVRNVDGQFSILVENDNTEGLDALVAYVNEDVILLSDEAMDFADKDKLEVGMEVTIYYHKDTIMAMSYPPMLGPDVIVINDHDKDDFISVMVSKFNKDSLSAEGDLVIHTSEDTVIVDKDGNKVDKEDLADKDLIVFYDIVLESYPAQTTPNKIIVMPAREEVNESKEFILEDELIKEIDKVTMIPLRLVGESLGYEVTWNQETKTAELVREAQWTAVTIGEDKYNFAKMLVELGTAPVIIDSKTYVPLNFAEEILKANVERVEDGTIRILY